MRLKDHIRKVLKEEYEIPLNVRRRLPFLKQVLHYEIPLNVRRRLPFLKQVLHNALISSYPCDDYDLNEFTHGIIWSVNEYFHWDNKEKEMTSEEAELTIRAYFLDDISEYYKEQTQDC